MDNLNKNIINMSLNSISKTNNPSQLEATFVVHDFKRSWNNAIITKEVCESNMHYLVGQYICCKYISRQENYGLDALGSHEAYLDINRDTGEEMVSTDTVPIGHITDVYIAEGTNSDGTEGEVFYCKATLWLNKFYNVLSFLNEMVENGINVPCSVEYGYSNFIMQDGVRYDQSPIYYEALCILNPIDRGSVKEVLPAYDSSKFKGFSFNEAIKADIENNTKLNQKEGELELENENIIVDQGNENGEVTEPIVEPTVDPITEPIVEDPIVEPTVEPEVVEPPVVEEPIIEEPIVEEPVVEEQPTDDTPTVESLSAENARLKEELTAEKESKITLVQENASLREQIGELEPFRAKVQEMEYNERLDEISNQYKEKFTALNGAEKFESVEVQELIKESLDVEKSINAKLALADILVDLATNSTPKTEPSSTTIKENCSKKVKSLVPTNKVGAEYCGINLG